MAAAAALTGLVVVAMQPASAVITTPASGAVVREAGPLSIKEDTGGRYTTTAAAQGCNGSTALRTPPASTRIQVIRVSDNVVVHDVTKITPNGFTMGGANANAPFDTSWNTTGAQPGQYRVVSTGVNVSRANSSAQCIGTPVGFSNHTFEYRPWQHKFTDLLATGKININTTTREAQWSVKTGNSPVVSFPNDTGNMHVFAAPLSASLELGDDPKACLDDPMACLPIEAVACVGACDARFVVIGYADGLGRNSLTGVFDVKTKAFVALARANAITRVLISFGPDLDKATKDFFGKLIQYMSNSSGVHLPALLSTKVRVRLFNDPVAERSTEIEISLAELVTIARGAPNGPNGANVLAPFSLGVGQILHTYQYAIAASNCSPTKPHKGYTVTESQLVPSLPPLVIPAPPPAFLIEPGGTLKHVEGDYPEGTGAHQAGPTALGPEIDTAPDASTGLPLWLPALNGLGTIADSDVDFVGHGFVVTIPEIYIPPIPFVLPQGACIGFGTLIGSGVAVFGENPLPLKLLPLLWKQQNPEVQALIAKINGLSAQALSNPTVQAALGAILAAIAGLPTS